MTAKGWHQRKHKRTSSKGKKFDAGRFVGKRGVTIKLAKPYDIEFTGVIDKIEGDNAVISDWTYGAGKEKIDVPKKAIISVKKPNTYTITKITVLDKDENSPVDKEWKPTYGYYIQYIFDGPNNTMSGGVWETLEEVRKEILDTAGKKLTIPQIKKIIIDESHIKLDIGM